MKYSILYSSVILLALSFMSSCTKEFLEVYPKGKLIAETTKDYEKALYTRDNLNLFTTAEILMGDEVAGVEPFFTASVRRTQKLFKWEGDVYLDGEDNTEMEVPMRHLYQYNKIINEVMDSKGGTEAEKRSIIAQAKVGRAWTYFLLINYFGKPYNSATSATDPGFPIITTANVTETTFTRASVKEVYDLIVNDLTNSLADLPPQITHRLLFSRTAGEMTLGKTLMSMGKFNEALPHLDSAFTYLANSTIPVKLYDYNVEFATGGKFLPVDFLFGPTYPGAENIEENIMARQTLNDWAFFNNEIVLSKETVALFDTDDLRLNWYSSFGFPFTPLPSGVLKRNGPLVAQYGCTVPDLYLLRAETKARLNDLAGARTDLEELRAKRMPNGTIANAVATNKNALIRFILDERVREFAVLGFRWFDMRRLSVDPDFSNTVIATHKVYDSQGAINETYTLTPERLTLRFSPKVMSFNPGMENNP